MIPTEINHHPVVAYVPLVAIDGADPEAGVAVCTIETDGEIVEYVVWYVGRVIGSGLWNATGGSYFSPRANARDLSDAFLQAATELVRRTSLTRRLVAS